MSEKRCKNCNSILHDDENYCLFCGTKQVETQVNPETTSNQSVTKDYSSIVVIIGIFIILIFGGLAGSKILLGIGIFLMSFYVRSKLDKKDKHKTSSNNKLMLGIIGLVIFIIFILGFNYSN